MNARIIIKFSYYSSRFTSSNDFYETADIIKEKIQADGERAIREDSYLDVNNASISKLVVVNVPSNNPTQSPTNSSVEPSSLKPSGSGPTIKPSKVPTYMSNMGQTSLPSYAPDYLDINGFVTIIISLFSLDIKFLI